MNCMTTRTSSPGRGRSGMTLPEVMVAVALSSILLAAAGSLWLFGSRSFAAMGNYVDLDARSRNALDQMSRDIREATRVTGFDNKGSTRWLQITNPAESTVTTYTWSPSTKALVCQKPGRADQVYLSECDRWDFELFQRAPQKGGNYVFYPATNTSGVYDPSMCKLINMTWKCSRTILGSKMNTESVQTAQIVLRNKQ